MCIYIPRIVFFTMIKLCVMTLIVTHTLYVALIQYAGPSPLPEFTCLRAPDCCSNHSSLKDK